MAGIKASLQSTMLQALLTVAIAYAVMLLLAAAFQRRLLYYPAIMDAAVVSERAAANGLEPWQNARGQLIGWKLPSRQTPVASVLVAHGNAGSALDRTYFAQPLHGAAAIDVYILEYPGYGSRAGSPSMRSLLAAADEAFALLPANAPRYLVGESLGSGVVAHLAGARGSEVSGIALFMPYDKLVNVAQAAVPFLPVSLVLRERFDPATWLASYRGPMKVVLAEFDEVIPPRFGQQLYDGYRGPKDLQMVAGARHNDPAEQTPAWWSRVLTFWETSSRATR